VAPQWLGYKESPIEYIHAVGLFYEIIKDGRIKIAKKIKEPVTFQEPCNTVRNAGYGDMLRYIINATCEDVREPFPAYEHNYCCMAGGGVINTGPPWKMVQMEGIRVKAEQFRDTGAKIIIAPCHNCHSGIEAFVKHYNLGMHVTFFTDILLDVMEKPEKKQ
jgi:Fe-S oxidoreductase